MKAVESNVTMTKVQTDELKRFSEQLRKDYETGFYDWDIKRCLRDASMNDLMRSVLAGAFGWFSSKNVPFACVYALCYNFVNDVLQVWGF